MTTHIITTDSVSKRRLQAASKLPLSIQRKSCTVFAVQADVEVTQGADKTKTYVSSEWAERAFCSVCGSNLWYRVTMTGPFAGAAHVAWGALDDISGMALTSEVFIDDKPEGYDLAGDRPRMTGEELFAMVQAAGEKASGLAAAPASGEAACPAAR